MLFLAEHVGIRNSYSSSNEWLNIHIPFTHLQVFLVFLILSLTYMIQKKTTKESKGVLCRRLLEDLGSFWHVLVS